MDELICETGFDAPCGRLVIWTYRQSIILCDWDASCEIKKRRLLRYLGKNVRNGTCDEAQKLKDQLDEYFAGKRMQFDLKLMFVGTDFQKSAWAALCKIPYGQTISYAEESAMIGKPKATRAVGTANGANPICIVTPCHRVIGKNGALTGYAGGVGIKEFLINLESRHTTQCPT